MRASKGGRHRDGVPRPDDERTDLVIIAAAGLVISRFSRKDISGNQSTADDICYVVVLSLEWRQWKCIQIVVVFGAGGRVIARR